MRISWEEVLSLDLAILLSRRVFSDISALASRKHKCHSISTWPCGRAKTCLWNPGWLLRAPCELSHCLLVHSDYCTFSALWLTVCRSSCTWKRLCNSVILPAPQGRLNLLWWLHLACSFVLVLHSEQILSFPSLGAITTCTGKTSKDFKV